MRKEIQEKLRLFEGDTKWRKDTLVFSDGPNGLRIEEGKHLGFGQSRQANMFPTASCVSCSFDQDLLYEYGKLLAEECRSEGVDVLLGPGVNHKRSPLGGRNFEYYSEDPLLSGKLAAAYIKGLQEQGIAVSLKHFAVNSREYSRQIYDAVVDERALHEIYLRPFEIAVKEGKPKTIMCAYNKVNGVYACENKKLMDTARSWGFDGIFISDWEAVSNPVHSYNAGLGLEMPGHSGSHVLLEKAYEAGQISDEIIAKRSQEMNSFMQWCSHSGRRGFNQIEHLNFIQKAAEESIVLLKNDGILPLDQKARIAVYGDKAIHPLMQGRGSSKVNTPEYDWFLQALDERKIHYAYASGFNRGMELEGYDAVIAFISDKEEGEEGRDRKSLALKEEDDQLIERLVETNAKVIVVIQSPGPIEMPWLDQVSAVIYEGMAGQRSGTALYRILSGEISPSGHLSETWPKKQEDVPCAAYFDNDRRQMQVRESIFTGYRYYDTYHVPVNFCFGYGLSYTDFAMQDLSVQKKEDGILARLKVRNTGSREGRCLVQMYVSMPQSRIARTAHALAGFASVSLKAEEEKEVSVMLHSSAFAYYDVQQKKDCIEAGVYQIEAGFSLDDLLLKTEITLAGEEHPYTDIPMNYGMHEVSDEDFAGVLEKVLGRMIVSAIRLKQKSYDADVLDGPIRQLLWIDDRFDWTSVAAVCDYMNRHRMKELRKLLMSMKKK